MHQNQQLTGFVCPVGSLILTCAETANDVDASTAPAHISNGDCTTSQMACAAPASSGPNALSGNGSGGGSGRISGCGPATSYAPVDGPLLSQARWSCRSSTRLAHSPASFLSARIAARASS